MCLNSPGVLRIESTSSGVLSLGLNHAPDFMHIFPFYEDVPPILCIFSHFMKICLLFNACAPFYDNVPPCSFYAHHPIFLCT